VGRLAPTPEATAILAAPHGPNPRQTAGSSLRLAALLPTFATKWVGRFPGMANVTTRPGGIDDA